MTFRMRDLVLVVGLGWLASACGPAESDSNGSGGSSTTGGSAGSTGSGSGGSGVGGKGSGGTGGSGGAGGGTGGAAGSAGAGGSAGAAGSGGSAADASSLGGGGSSTGGAGGSADGSTGERDSGATDASVDRRGGGGQNGADASASDASGNPGNADSGRAADSGSSGAFSPCPSNGDPCRILPIGDSITVGINYEGAWRVEIFHRALMAGQKITYTGHDMNGPQMVDMMSFPRRFEAQSGITIDGISAKIDTDKAFSTPTPADIVLMHIGTNDMNGTPAGAPDRLAKLIDKITTALPNALLVVAKIIPLNGSVKAYNDAIPGLVQTRVAQGKHVLLVDLNTDFPPGAMDTVHPYKAGYDWMGDKFYEVIKDLLPK